MKTIPFDLSIAKTPDNPNGLEVVDGIGRRVRIICTDVKSNHPICAAIQTSLVDKVPHEEIKEFWKDGTCAFTNQTKHDLLLVAPEPRHVEVWGFIYKNAHNEWTPFPIPYSTKAEAEKNAAVLKCETIVIKLHEYDE